MNVESRRSRVRVLVVASLAGLALFACTGGDKAGSGDSLGGAAGGQPADGVPAPRITLTDASPDSEFLRYGESLSFATDSPGVVTVNRTVGGVSSVLKVHSENRLPFTRDSAYVTGRIIAKFVTSSAPSAYGAPVGTAYLWVKATPGGHAGTLIWRNDATGATGRSAVQQYHSSGVPVRSEVVECDDLGGGIASDTILTCCMCGGHFNCPLVSAMGRIDPALVEARLKALGLTRP